MKKTFPNESARTQRQAMREIFNFDIDTALKVVNIKNDPTEVIVFDTETSGLDSEKDRIVQISGIKFECKDGKFTEKENGRLDIFINQPEYDENKVIKDPAYEKEHGHPKTFGILTGITNAYLATCPTEDEIFDTIYEYFGDDPIICGHNTPFDYGFMVAMYIRHGKNFLPKPTRRLDTLALARDLIPKEDAPKKVGDDGKEKSTYTLGALAQMYGIDYAEEDASEKIGFHNSMNDVIVCGRLLQVLVNEFAKRELKFKAEEESIPPIVKERAIIKGITFWEGYRGFSRVYINAFVRGSLTSFFYDIRGKKWGEKEEGTMIATDMEMLISDAFELANVNSEAEFAKIRTVIEPDETFLSRYK